MTDETLPFISVIVPFYNIEECVEYCLDSVLAQDYMGEYEVLCIDDGSTDGTADRLNAYAVDNPRVRVLHKPNGGPSEARNYGVEHAKGDYVAFVDGDDIVSPYYLSSLAEGLRFGENVMVAGVHQMINGSEIRAASWAYPSEIEPMDKAYFLREICYQRVLASVWARLAKKSLFLECPNPTGKVYEDTYIAPEYVDSCSGIVLIKQPIYGYVVRGGSIVHPISETMDRCLQHFDAIDKFCGSVAKYFSAESDEAIIFRATEFSRLWRRLDVVRDFPEQAGARQKEIQAYVKARLTRILIMEGVSTGNKVRFMLLANSPSLYRVAFSVYDRVFKGLS